MPGKRAAPPVTVTPTVTPAAKRLESTYYALEITNFEGTPNRSLHALVEAIWNLPSHPLSPPLPFFSPRDLKESYDTNWAELAKNRHQELIQPALADLNSQDVASPEYHITLKNLCIAVLFFSQYLFDLKIESLNFTQATPPPPFGPRLFEFIKAIMDTASLEDMRAILKLFENPEVFSLPLPRIFIHSNRAAIVKAFLERFRSTDPTFTVTNALLTPELWGSQQETEYLLWVDSFRSQESFESILTFAMEHPDRFNDNDAVLLDLLFEIIHAGDFFRSRTEPNPTERLLTTFRAKVGEEKFFTLLKMVHSSYDDNTALEFTCYDDILIKLPALEILVKWLEERVDASDNPSAYEKNLKQYMPRVKACMESLGECELRGDEFTRLKNLFPHDKYPRLSVIILSLDQSQPAAGHPAHRSQA